MEVRLLSKRSVPSTDRWLPGASIVTVAVAVVVGASNAATLGGAEEFRNLRLLWVAAIPVTVLVVALSINSSHPSPPQITTIPIGHGQERYSLSNASFSSCCRPQNLSRLMFLFPPHSQIPDDSRAPHLHGYDGVLQDFGPAKNSQTSVDDEV